MPTDFATGTHRGALYRALSARGFEETQDHVFKFKEDESLQIKLEDYNWILTQKDKEVATGTYGKGQLSKLDEAFRALGMKLPGDRGTTLEATVDIKKK